MATSSTEQNDRNIITLVDRLLIRASAERASDIHIEPRNETVRVRFRIDGVLVERPGFNLEQGTSITSRLKIMSQLDISEKRLPQDGAFEFTINQVPVPFRVATFPTEYGEKIVVRVLSRADAALSLERLGLSPDDLVTLRRVAQHQEGIVLVTGPTGAGKTTTMYALLHELENKTRNITTLEDPIEYRFDSIIQGQVNTKLVLHFPRVSNRFSDKIRMLSWLVRCEMPRQPRLLFARHSPATWYFLLYTPTASSTRSFVSLTWDLSASSLHQRFARSLHSVSSDVYASTAVNPPPLRGQSFALGAKRLGRRHRGLRASRLCVLQSNRLFRSSGTLRDSGDR